MDTPEARGARGAALLGLIAFGVAWTAGLLWSPPTPVYDHIGGTWRVDRVASPVEMVWYGRVMLAWAVALPAGALGRLAGRRGVAFGPLWEAWAFTALGLAAVLSAVAFWP